MLFAIDIDATIATDRNGYARYLNNKLKLGIEESVIEQIKCYHDFHSLPAVQNYLQEPDQRDYYQAIYNRLQHEPEIQQNLDPLPNAVQALNTIAQWGNIIYITCRQPGAEALTREWLARAGFPSPEHVTICAHYHAKYLAAYEQAAPREKIILIDDHAEEMVKAFFIMAKNRLDIAVSLRRRLAVVAFDHTEPPTFHFKVPFPVIALPSWHPNDLAQLQQKKRRTAPDCLK